MTSTERGLLIPRVDLDDATTAAPVTAPVAEGLLIYNETGTEPHGFYYWNGSVWKMVGSNGYITAFSWTDATDLLRITEAGTNWDVTIDNEADDVTLADVQAACTDDFHNIGGTDAVNDADNVVGNEYNTSMGWDDGTNTVSVTDGGGTKSVVLTGFDNYNNWKLQANGGATTNITSGATVNFVQSGATTVSRAANTITISSTDNNTWQQNTQALNGYVLAGGTNYNKVWKTDGSGNPAWGDDPSAGTGHVLVVYRVNASPNGTTVYLHGNTNTALEATTQIVIPACTVTKLRVYLQLAGGSPSTFTVNKNTVATAAVVSAGGVGASTWTGSVTFAEGDLLSVKAQIWTNANVTSVVIIYE